MARQKEYWEAYADHCIRHPHNYVSYITFRQRCKKRGEKLAVRLWKFESAEKMWKVFEEKKNFFLAQKEIQKSRQKIRTIWRIIIGLLLLGVGIVIWIMM